MPEPWVNLQGICGIDCLESRKKAMFAVGGRAGEACLPGRLEPRRL